jgi:histidinol phosphatase-like enzyme
VYYCPHQDQDGCDCRKPKPGLLLRAQGEHAFAFAETFLIGDSELDLMAAHQVGCPAILVRAGNPGDVDPKAAAHQGGADPLLEVRSTQRVTVRDLYEAVQFILRVSSKQ